MEPEIHKHSKRLYEIDLLRFIAAISVVFYHYTYRGYVEGNYSPLSFSVLGAFTKYGYLGVELFFIISGYVVLLSAQNKTVRQFFISRTTRLYPAFWVACTLTFLVEYIWGFKTGSNQMSPFLYATIRQYGWNMTMLNGFVGVMPVDGVYWSLTVEIRFYLLIALLIFSKQLSRVNLFIALWLIYAAVVGPSGISHLSPLLLPRYAAYFAAGMLFYLMKQPNERSLIRYILLLASYALSIRSALERANGQSLLGNTHLSELVIMVAITLFFGIFLLITFKKINLNKYDWLVWLGILTYPLYLLHQHIGFVIFQRFNGHFNKYVILITTVFIMLIGSYLVYVLVEKRLSKSLTQLMDRWLPKF